MVILRSQNKITDFFMILAWASPFNCYYVVAVAFYANIDRLTDEAFNDPTVKWLATPKTRGISSCSAPSQLKLQAFDTSVRGVTIDMELKEVYNYVFDLAGSATAYANGDVKLLLLL